MTRKLTDAKDRQILGVKTPRIWSAPPAVSSAGVEVIELAAMAGLHLDAAQQFVIVNALGERPDGKWAASSVGVCEPRQNGKGGIIEARALGGAFLFYEPLIVYTAHLFDTASEAFLRFDNLLEANGDLSNRVKKVSRSHGQEGFEFYGPKGRRITGSVRFRFRTRTKGGGRGFTGFTTFFDECMIFPEPSHAAVLPIMSAQDRDRDDPDVLSGKIPLSGPQGWYLGSAVDQMVHEDGVVFAQIREHGIAGDDPRLAYFEYSAAFPEGVNSIDDIEPHHADDKERWAEANPAYGIRISDEAIMAERRRLTLRSFVVERLGWGDWPSTEEEAQAVIDLGKWRMLHDHKSSVEDSMVLAFDATPEREWGSISAAGGSPDGGLHADLVDHREDITWMVNRIAELVEEHVPIAVVVDGASPAVSLVPKLEKRGIEVTVTDVKQMTTACSDFFDLIVDSAKAIVEMDEDDDEEPAGFRHAGQPELIDAIKAAKKRPLGDAWALSRKNSTGDISPLVSMMLATWGVQTLEEDIGAIAVDVDEEIRAAAKRRRAA